METAVSVIIPVYNCEKTVGRCINSVLNQTLANIEVIAVNDGSDDSTLKVLKGINDDRLKIISHLNYGQGYARNNGMSVANGKYIAFVDADDTIEECMDDLIAEIKKNSKILEFHFVEGIIKLHIDDIIYIETQRHKNVFYTEKGTFQIYKKLDELENELKNMGFVRAHLSFLVNMKYITKISSYVMTLTTGKKIPVPKARYAQVKREYMLYKGEE